MTIVIGTSLWLVYAVIVGISHKAMKDKSILGHERHCDVKLYGEHRDCDCGNDMVVWFAALCWPLTVMIMPVPLGGRIYMALKERRVARIKKAEETAKLLEQEGLDFEP